MNDEDFYYTSPSDECFNEVKEMAIKIWKSYPYPSEKVEKVEKIENIRDNFMYIVSMFDPSNQKKLSLMLSDKSKKEISDRMKAGGAPDEYNYFIKY